MSRCGHEKGGIVCVNSLYFVYIQKLLEEFILVYLQYVHTVPLYTYVHSSAIRDLLWGGLYTYRIITIQLSPGVFNKESLGYPVK